MNRDSIITLLKGLWIGGTMTVPGVSGGSMAMIMGVYDRLISSVSGFFKEPAKCFRFLFLFVLGAGVGMVLFARMIGGILAGPFNIPARFFFLGAVAGGVPMIFREAGVKKVDVKTILYVVFGIVLVLALAMLPEGLFEPQDTMSVSGILLQLVGGVIIAIGLVLPGISVSQMLYMLGLYEGIMANIATMDFLPLIPLGIGVVGGIFVTALVLESLMERHPQPTYLIILGFMFGSLPELFPAVPNGWELIASVFTTAAGFAVLYFMSKKEAKL